MASGGEGVAVDDGKGVGLAVNTVVAAVVGVCVAIAFRVDVGTGLSVGDGTASGVGDATGSNLAGLVRALVAVGIGSVAAAVGAFVSFGFEVGVEPRAMLIASRVGSASD